MATLSVIGNISRDLAVYPDGRTHELLGGAALHVARSAARSGLTSAPISVIGRDLGWIGDDPRLADVDLTCVKVVNGPSCSFRLIYNAAGKLAETESSFGVAKLLTDHCLTALGRDGLYHVCCRRPLDVGTVLGRLATAGQRFSVDFHLASIGHMVSVATPFLADAQIVFVNAAEYLTLSSSMDPAHLAVVVISNGPDEARVLRFGRTTAAIRPPNVSPVELTGAGDVLAGVFLAGWTRGLGDAVALRDAVAAATRSVVASELTLKARDAEHTR
jgi:sugar/nucleoside kinase (ribokinase family)